MGVTQSTDPTSVAMSEVENEHLDARSAFARVEEAIKVLAGRLKPVINERPEKVQDDTESALISVSPVAENFRNLGFRADTAADRLNTLINNLAI